MWSPHHHSHRACMGVLVAMAPRVASRSVPTDSIICRAQGRLGDGGHTISFAGLAHVRVNVACMAPVGRRID